MPGSGCANFAPQAALACRREDDFAISESMRDLIASAPGQVGAWGQSAHFVFPMLLPA